MPKKRRTPPRIGGVQSNLRLVDGCQINVTYEGQTCHPSTLASRGILHRLPSVSGCRSKLLSTAPSILSPVAKQVKEEMDSVAVRTDESRPQLSARESARFAEPLRSLAALTSGEFALSTPWSSPSETTSGSCLRRLMSLTWWRLPCRTANRARRGKRQ
jgi:hypothetical protein